MPPEVKTIRIDQAVFQQTLEKKLADLPPLPVVVTRIMQTINNPNASAEDLNRLISLDQGLSSKILRIVNSAYYGFPKRIGTITHAVIILGFNTVRNLVLGVSAFGLLSQKGTSAGLNRMKFWEHSVAAAVAASILAKKKQIQNRAIVEEAFVGGLLHDIGELFLDCYFPVQYAITLACAAREEVPMIEAERTVLGMDHVMIGRQIAERWNFPPLLTTAVGAHDAPAHGADFFEAAALVHAADWLAWQKDYGTSEHLVKPSLSPVVGEWLAFTAEDMDWTLCELEKQFATAQDLLQIAQNA